MAPLFFCRGGEHWTGTGVILNGHGLVLTADHVLPNEAGFQLLAGHNFDGPPVTFNSKFTIVDRFPDSDLAIIRCDELVKIPFDGSIEFVWDRLNYGQSLGSLGYPLPLSQEDTSVVNGQTRVMTSVCFDLLFKSFFLSGVGWPPDFSEQPQERKEIFYQLDSFSYGGHSGGPVFDSEGRLAAIMHAARWRSEGDIQISFSLASAVSNIRATLEALA